MTIQEAIIHTEEVIKNTNCEKCKKEHEQLKSFLIEYRDFKKNENKILEVLFDEIFEKAQDSYKSFFEYKNGIMKVPYMQNELKLVELRSYIKGLRFALAKIADLEVKVKRVQ